ncbi:glycosyltransferase [Riemerella anatipestifer]
MNNLVSVVMITYGHENYISKAIEGVFMQKTNFPIEFIIANDNSPDSTDDVIKNILTTVPSHIEVKYTKHTHNKGMMGNFIWALSQAKGKYVAYFDGDDYWIDENKLQKQYDFMESHQDYAICCHNFKLQDGENISDKSFFDDLIIKETSSIEDLARQNIVPTLTSFFRNIKVEFPQWSYSSPLGDLVLFLNVARFGKIKYFNEKMAVYRQNVGVWSGKKQDYSKLAWMYSKLANDFKDLPNVYSELKKQEQNHVKYYLETLTYESMLRDDYFKKLPLLQKFKLLLKKTLK